MHVIKEQVELKYFEMHYNVPFYTIYHHQTVN